MSEPSDPRRIDSIAAPRQSWIVPIIALAMFALFLWLFLGGRADAPDGDHRDRTKKGESVKTPRDGVQR
jgi:hypothetical protein